MTLIDYLNRVHFAENILEEAVWAELDRRRDAVFCILTSPDQNTGELGERIRAGLPREIQAVTVETPGHFPTEAEARRVADLFRANGCTALLAFGRGYVINLAKAVRLLVSHGAPLSRFSESEGGALRISSAQPDFVAVPALQGFAAGFNGMFSILLDAGPMIDIASRKLVPTVTIGDPTVARSEPVRVQASAGVDAVAHCAEALLSSSYNPPANGIALDGLSRGLAALTTISNAADIKARRELMAACMNSAMVQQKGAGPVYAMSASICAEARGALDKGAIKRLLLPRLLAFYAEAGAMDGSQLLFALGAATGDEAVQRITQAFAPLPLPGSLAEIGVTADQLPLCAERAAQHWAWSNSPCRPAEADILTILHSVY